MYLQVLVAILASLKEGRFGAILLKTMRVTDTRYWTCIFVPCNAWSVWIVCFLTSGVGSTVLGSSLHVHLLCMCVQPVISAVGCLSMIVNKITHNHKIIYDSFRKFYGKLCWRNLLTACPCQGKLNVVQTA